jgi:hypothetical protein
MPTLENLNHTWYVDGVEVYRPHAAQLLVHESRARSKVLKWARRAGKGRCYTFVLLDLFVELGQAPRDRTLSPPFFGVIVAPTYKLSFQPWADLQGFIPPQLIQNIVQDEKRIFLKPYGSLDAQWGKGRIGGIIEIRSADNESSLQGFGADIEWLTEAQELPRSALEKLEPTLMSPGRAGIQIVEGIPPEDPDHWMNDLFDMGSDPENLVFASRLSYLDNPMLSEADKAYILRRKALMTDREWNRHYMAQDPEGSERPMNIEAVLVGAVDWEKQLPQKDHTYDMGVDLGKKVDATVITIWDKTTMPWRLTYFRRITRLDWPVQRAAIQELQEKWLPKVDGRPTGKVYIDSTGLGDPVYDELRYDGVPVEAVIFSAPERERLLNKLAIALERRRVRMPIDERITREFNSMRRHKVSEATGTIRWQVRDGMNDDAVFSCALGLFRLPASDRTPPPRKPVEHYAYA